MTKTLDVRLYFTEAKIVAAVKRLKESEADGIAVTLLCEALGDLRAAMAETPEEEPTHGMG